MTTESQLADSLREAFKSVASNGEGGDPTAYDPANPLDDPMNALELIYDAMYRSLHDGADPAPHDPASPLDDPMNALELIYDAMYRSLHDGADPTAYDPANPLDDPMNALELIYDAMWRSLQDADEEPHPSGVNVLLADGSVHSSGSSDDFLLTIDGVDGDSREASASRELSPVSSADVEPVEPLPVPELDLSAGF